MAKIKTITLYTFDELSDEAKDKALDECRFFQVDGDWWDSVYEDAKNVGLEITSFDLDRNRHAKGKFLASAEETAHKIEQEHGTECTTYQTAREYLRQRDDLIDGWPKDEDGEHEKEWELDSRLDDLDGEFLKSILEDYSINLEKEYEYLTSDESVQEGIEANEYTFTEDGKMES